MLLYYSLTISSLCIYLRNVGGMTYFVSVDSSPSVAWPLLLNPGFIHGKYKFPI